MGEQYEVPGAARYSVEPSGDGELIRIKARRQVFALLFLPVWLTFWTMGSVAAIHQVSQHFVPFLLVWLGFWALGWVFAGGTLVWMLTGVESVRVINGDLEIANQALGFSRRWLFDGTVIRQLGAVSQPGWPSSRSLQVPFTMASRQGGDPVRLRGANEIFCRRAG